jgi:hypothetical protein
MKKELALAIVEEWKKDTKVCDVPGLIDYFQAQGKFAPGNIRVKVFVGTGNRLASSALWDNQFNRAAGLLMKHGLKDKSTIAVPSKGDGSYIGSRRLSGSVNNPKSDWKYVK